VSALPPTHRYADVIRFLRSNPKLATSNITPERAAKMKDVVYSRRDLGTRVIMASATREQP